MAAYCCLSTEVRPRGRRSMLLKINAEAKRTKAYALTIRLAPSCLPWPNPTNAHLLLFDAMLPQSNWDKLDDTL